MASLVQISQAFKKFGISDGDDSVMVVLVHNKTESQSLSDIVAKVNGQQIPAEDVSLLTDLTQIKQVFHFLFILSFPTKCRLV